MRKETLRGFDGLLPRHKGAAITIGNFDGVHLGHQRIISRLMEQARSLDTRAMAISFDPHPFKVLMPERPLQLMTLPEERARLLHLHGADAVLYLPFSHEFAAMGPEEFITDFLVGRLGVRAIVVGHGFSFGKGRAGDTDLLRRRGRRYGFSVSVVRSVKLGGSVVSSSRIRKLIEQGKVREAACLLGRPYMIEGSVVTGAGRGDSVLHTPTANMSTPNELLPGDGVYSVRVELEGRLHDAVANIGNNPTFTPDSREIVCEVHLLDFKADLRGRELRAYFIERIREERTFPSAEALMAQIALDIKDARKSLENTPACFGRKR